jgi:hypothetical protein
MEALVGVDVANAGENRLIEKRGLDGSAGVGERVQERTLGDVECIWPEFAPRAVECFARAEGGQAAESARVTEDKPPRE